MKNLVPSRPPEVQRPTRLWASPRAPWASSTRVANGVPDPDFARACAADRVTVIIEDEMPNYVLVRAASQAGTQKDFDAGYGNRAAAGDEDLSDAPAQEELLLAAPDADVKLRVTLLYFAEPSTFRRGSAPDFRARPGDRGSGS